MRKMNKAFIVLLLQINTGMVVASQTSPSPVDFKFDKIEIGKDKLDKVIELYGKGIFLKLTSEKISIIDIPDAKDNYPDQMCYFDRKNNQYISFDLGPDYFIEGINISKAGYLGCKGKAFSKGKLCSKRGLCLNDKYEKILDLYGKPQKLSKKQDILIAEYHADHKNDPNITIAYDAFLHFKNNRLIELHIHHGE